MTTFIRQDSQIRNSDDYDDTLDMANAESSAETIEDDLNYIRSQLKILSGRNGWSDVLLDDFNITSIHDKRFIYWNLNENVVSVPAAQNYVLLTGTGKPSDNIAYGASSIGAASAQLPGAVGSNSTVVSSNYGNLLMIRNASTNGAIYTASSSAIIYGLLQVGSAATDGNPFGDAGDDQGQISFVYMDPSTETFVAAEISDIQGLDIQYSYKNRVNFYNIPEWAFDTSVQRTSKSFDNPVLDYIQLNTLAGAPPYAEGRLFYDNVNKALGFYNDEADSTAQIPYESWFRGRNETGFLIPNGTAVYQGPVHIPTGIPTIIPANASSLETCETFVGITTHSVENESNGIVVTRGTLRDYDTDTPTWSSGDALWLGTSDGELTNVRPAIPNQAIRVGVVGIIDPANGTIDVRAGWPRTQSAEDIAFPYVGSVTHVDNLAEAINHIWSSASLGGFDIDSDKGDGTVDLTAGDVILRSVDSTDSPIVAYHIDATVDLAIPANDQSFIYIDYHGGTPTVMTTTDPTTIDGRTEVPIWMVTRVVDGVIGDVIHVVDLREYSSDFAYRQSKESFYTRGFQHVPGGSAVSHAGTRNLIVTAGSFYIVGKEQTHIAFNTTVAGTANANVFMTAYYNGSAWVRTINQKQLSNTQYNNIASGLVAISNNKFAVHWIYITLNDPSQLVSLYGQAEYATLSDAQAAKAPSLLPPELQTYSTGQLIAKVIVQQGVVSPFSDIQTPFETGLISTTTPMHNNLSGLQGGTSPNEYYHLTSTQYGNMTDGADYVNFSAGRNAIATNVYLRGPDGTPTNLAGFVIPFNATIVRITAATQGAETWTAEVRKNNDPTVIASLAMTTATGISTLLSVNVNAGDEIQMYCNGTAISYPVVTVYLKRR